MQWFKNRNLGIYIRVQVSLALPHSSGVIHALVWVLKLSSDPRVAMLVGKRFHILIVLVKKWYLWASEWSDWICW